MNIGDRLKVAMNLAGVSQAELARACGVKPPSVSGWLSGRARFLRGENLLAAASALGVSQSWLATGHGEMIPTVSQNSAIESWLFSLSDHEKKIAFAVAFAAVSAMREVREGVKCHGSEQ